MRGFFSLVYEYYPILPAFASSLNVLQWISVYRAAQVNLSLQCLLVLAFVREWTWILREIKPTRGTRSHAKAALFHCHVWMRLYRLATVRKVKFDPPLVQHVEPLHHSDPHYRFNLLVRAMQQKLRTYVYI